MTFKKIRLATWIASLALALLAAAPAQASTCNGFDYTFNFNAAPPSSDSCASGSCWWSGGNAGFDENSCCSHEGAGNMWLANLGGDTVWNSMNVVFNGAGGCYGPSGNSSCTVTAWIATSTNFSEGYMDTWQDSDGTLGSELGQQDFSVEYGYNEVVFYNVPANPTNYNGSNWTTLLDFGFYGTSGLDQWAQIDDVSIVCTVPMD